jgi:hypothetical protein
MGAYLERWRCERGSSSSRLPTQGSSHALAGCCRRTGCSCGTYGGLRDRHEPGMSQQNTGRTFLFSLAGKVGPERAAQELFARCVQPQPATWIDRTAPTHFECGRCRSTFWNWPLRIFRFIAICRLHSTARRPYCSEYTIFLPRILASFSAIMVKPFWTSCSPPAG